MHEVSRRAEVIGGGIGGLTAAAALARQGWSVTLHERDTEIRAFGSGIYLWSNGMAVLDRLGVLEKVIRGAHCGRAIETRNNRNSTVASVPVNSPGGVRVLTVLRENLINGLVDACHASGVRFESNSAAKSVEPEGSVTFADGRTEFADLVVVADGVGSRLRDRLGLLRQRRSLDQRCARVLIDRAPGLVPAGDEANYIEYMSGKRFVLYTPSSATQVYIAFVCPAADFAAQGDVLPRDEWIRSFPHLRPLVEAVVGDLRWDDFEQVELETWSTGKVAVLGDAAHAQPPYLGQGGGCAMTNAFGLAHAVTHTEGSLRDALTSWEATERPLIEHTQRFSYRVGQLNNVPDLPRTALLTVLGRSSAVGRSRLRAATALPTGCSA
ncbi:NAD(P)/FAD-dependent oxidoreductase [Rhodococcus sp. IEGM 1381]|uniref:FAD-dependent oxidoreductase n=1 Tax=Rhodococcus sp. IEGM 1381 TaxID=3047085 RepID=UPI0024B6F31A|nr:NAD(P)/FAD-dependent oxidoreductase [Rhodococcus sp. IEGM 1381]MDI9896870.1 NAD(P)/FAD-dependent oxidoreductase [Rhodococcus sp. IEGM 1381]